MICANSNNNNDSKLKGQEALLEWCRQQTEDYKDVNIRNMTDSWKNGLAFCALIHRNRPDLINFEELSKEEPRKNLELAFAVAERELGIPPLVDVTDVAETPEELSILTYVSLFYHKFKDQETGEQKPKKTRRYMLDILCDEKSREKLNF
ncbi:alpha-actinin-like protein 1 [Actinia tenebrosa]|uniref:Alpha-actinin-like protein 1 n=1 Tax=Actinia tenebrosa TaxID=6105 RepID=A0A6P8J5E9_ACTTE|nr:alpha-actinin-like protein 1 [Actinia tenebrosa]